ncbi:MAG TPA: S9 family peptidase, partial [Bacteroidales bacterium]|nr:S9 family peptidase [Bacteroidales bacterium]
MTPEKLWYLGRISEMQISPNKDKLLFGVTWYDWHENKGNRELYIINLNDKKRQKITSTPKSEYNARWRPDGQKIGYLYPDDNGEMQLFEMNIDGSKIVQISYIKGGINGFEYAPDQKHIAFFKDVKIIPDPQDIYPDLPKANARIYEDLLPRHWDQWVKSFSHLFIANYAEKIDTIGQDVMEHQTYECPLYPFAGNEQINWHPNGNQIAFTAKAMMGRDYALSTNSDIYIYDLLKNKLINLTEGMLGYDQNPVFSPDGKKIAWESMEREGYESDRIRPFIYDFTKDTMWEAVMDYETHATNLKWSTDGNFLHFISPWHGTQQIYLVDIYQKKPIAITSGTHNYNDFLISKQGIIGIKQSMSKPDEIYMIDPLNGKESEISFINKYWLDQLKMGEVRPYWINTVDKKKMLVWVIYPPNFDSTKKYPAILYCEGGPQSMVGQFWSYRWNFQLMAANGYIVVAPNRRGLPGFGMEWLEQISGDYSGLNIQDYLTAIDTFATAPYVDKDALGAVGASYGGYSVYYLAGVHNKRFKAFIAHSGMFNLESQYLETDEYWFVNWDLGGPYWDKNNKIAQRSYANSPHRLVDKWDTPILVMHGENDFRISYTQGLQAFQAARLRNIPAKLVVFPDENHWILKPQNGILWQREFFGWLDKYLKK